MFSCEPSAIALVNKSTIFGRRPPASSQSGERGRCGSRVYKISHAHLRQRCDSVLRVARYACMFDTEPPNRRASCRTVARRQCCKRFCELGGAWWRYAAHLRKRSARNQDGIHSEVLRVEYRKKLSLVSSERDHACNLH